MKNNSMAVGAIALLVGLAVGYFALSGQKEIAEVEKVVEVEAQAETNPVNIRVQAVIGMQTTEVKMLKDFMADVTKLTDGEVTFEVLPAGAVVGVKETLDAVDSGLVDGGFAWTHYWSGKHPAAMLFGSPVAGAGVGIDNIAFVSWFQNAGGKELYDRLWD